MASIRIRVKGLERTEKRLREMGDHAKDLSPVLGGSITDSVHKFFAKQFSTQGAHGGGRAWAPLAPFTVMWRARFGRAAGPTLQFTKGLWASLSKRGGVGSIRVVKPHQLTIGTEDPTAAMHQEGYPLTFFGRPTGKRVEARELVPDRMPTAIVDSWDRDILRFLEA